MSDAVIPRIDAASLGGRRMRYFDFIMVAFVVILLLSNIIGAGKVANVELPVIGAYAFGAGILFFPLSYVIGDVLTEVYGYARARRCIWAGFAAMLFMALMATVVVALPPLFVAVPPLLAVPVLARPRAWFCVTRFDPELAPYFFATSELR